MSPTRLSTSCSSKARAYREPSAAERAAWAKQQRKELDDAKKQRAKDERRSKRRSRGPADSTGGVPTDHENRVRRPLLAIALLVVLTIIAWLIFGRSSSSSSNNSGLKQPNHVTTYYALPSDVSADPTMTDAIRHDVDTAQAWLADQTNGRKLRIDKSDGDISVQTKQLDATSDDLKAGGDPAGLVADAFRKKGALPNTILLVFVPVNRGVECGKGSAVGVAIIWVGSCGGLRPSASDTWPAGTTTVVAHELMHSLGAVAPCAPHYVAEGHVDTRDDLMYAESATDGAVELDPGHDDYYDTKNPNCPGIEHHPAWTTA